MLPKPCSPDSLWWTGFFLFHFTPNSFTPIHRPRLNHHSCVHCDRSGILNVRSKFTFRTAREGSRKLQSNSPHRPLYQLPSQNAQKQNANPEKYCRAIARVYAFFRVLFGIESLKNPTGAVIQNRAAPAKQHINDNDARKEGNHFVFLLGREEGTGRTASDNLPLASIESTFRWLLGRYRCYKHRHCPLLFKS